MFHPTYKPPPAFCTKNAKRGGGGCKFAGHYGTRNLTFYIDFSNPVEDRAKLLYTSDI